MPDLSPADPFGGGPSSELRYRSLVDTLPAVVFVDVVEEGKTRTVYIGPGIEEMTGHPAEAFYGDDGLFDQQIHPADAGVALAAFHASIGARSPYDVRFRLIHVDGSTRWIHDRGAPMFDAEGELVGWQGVMFDVTGAHDAEEALVAAEGRYRTLVEQLPVVAYAVADDPYPEVLYVSPTSLDVLGIAPERFADDLRFPLFVWEEERDDAARAWERAIATGGRFSAEYRVERPDATLVWIRDTCMRVKPASGPPFWQGVMLDITAEKEREVALQASETTFRNLVERLPAVVYLETDESPSRSLYVSPNATRILGRSPEEHISLAGNWIRLIHPEDRVGFEEAWGGAVDTGDVFDREYRWMMPDDDVIWVHDRAWPIEGADGIRYWQGVLVNITAQREAERELLGSQARYRALVENIPAVIYEMDDDDERRTLYVSPRIEELLGYDRQEWLDQPDIWTELLHPDDREMELDAHDRQSRSGEPWSREYRLIAADGRQVWVRDQARLVRDTAGRPVTWQGVLLDMTAQKEAEARLQLANEELEMRVLERTAALEEANALMSLEIAERRRAEADLRDAEERSRILVEELPAAAYRWQMWSRTPDDWSELYVSPAIERILGFTVREWHEIEGLWRDRLHPHDRDRVLAAAERSIATGDPFEVECRYLHKDGHVVWVLDRATLLRRNEEGRPWVFQGVMVDVTDRRDAERKAEEAELRFLEVIEQGPVMTYAYALRGDPPVAEREYASPQIARLLGVPNSVEALSAERWAEMVHPDDLAHLQAQTRGVLINGDPWDVRYRMIAADGRILWIRDQGRPIERDDAGRPIRVAGAISEVTQEVERERADAARIHLLESTVAAVPAILWTEQVTDGRSLYTYISPRSVDLLGYTPEELMVEREHFPRLVHPEDRDRVTAGSVAAEADPEGVWEDEYRVLHRDGSVRWLQAHSRRVTPLGEDPAVWQGVTIDVTDRHAPADERSDTAATERSDDARSG